MKNISPWKRKTISRFTEKYKKYSFLVKIYIDIRNFLRLLYITHKWCVQNFKFMAIVTENTNIELELIRRVRNFI